MELLIAILGGSVGAALVAGFFGVWTTKFKRKAEKEDRAENIRVADCATRGAEIKALSDRLDIALLADRVILYDRIKHLGKSYIARGWVTVEELEDLNMMHGVYHDKDKLDGNGFLKNLMYTVNHQLEKRAE